MAGVKWTADITHHLPGATRYADPVATYSVSRDGDVLEEELTLDDLLQFLDGVMEPWQAHLVWWAAWSRWAPMCAGPPATSIRRRTTPPLPLPSRVYLFTLGRV